MSTDTLLDLPAPEPPPTTGLTAKHMEQMLRRHYLPEGRQPGGIFAPEIGSPCGKRRADLIWMPTTIAGGKGELHGHEVKVSRADLIAELDDPTKADPWAQHCTRWWLVLASPSLANGLTIPDPWGVLAPPSGRRTRSMTVIREAPKLTPLNPAPGVARVAAWLMYGGEGQVSKLQRDLDYQKREVERLGRELANLRASGVRQDDPFTRRVAGIVTAVQHHDRTSSGLWRDVDDETIVAAILNHTAIAVAAEAVRNRTRMVVREIQRIAAEPLSYALAEFKNAEKLANDLTKPANALEAGR